MDPQRFGTEELDAREMRETEGGARMWRPSGYTVTGEPIYAWVEE